MPAPAVRSMADLSGSSNWQEPLWLRLTRVGHSHRVHEIKSEEADVG